MEHQSVFPVPRKETAMDRKWQEPRAELFEAGLRVQERVVGAALRFDESRIPVPDPRFNGGVQWLSICPRSKK